MKLTYPVVAMLVLCAVLPEQEHDQLSRMHTRTLAVSRRCSVGISCSPRVARENVRLASITLLSPGPG
jgi:hypothetical protein